MYGGWLALDWYPMALLGMTAVTGLCSSCLSSSSSCVLRVRAECWSRKKSLRQAFPKFLLVKCLLTFHWPKLVTWWEPESELQGSVKTHGQRWGEGELGSSLSPITGLLSTRFIFLLRQKTWSSRTHKFRGEVCKPKISPSIRQSPKPHQLE